VTSSWSFILQQFQLRQRNSFVYFISGVHSSLAPDRRGANIFGFLPWNLFHVSLLAAIFWSRCRVFGKILYRLFIILFH